MRRPLCLALAALALVGACGPPEIASGGDEGTSTSPATTGDDGTTSTTAIPPDDESAGSDESDDTETGEEPVSECGDGVPDPGLLCYERHELEVEGYVRELLVHDFNADGVLDLVAVYDLGGRLWLLNDDASVAETSTFGHDSYSAFHAGAGPFVTGSAGDILVFPGSAAHPQLIPGDGAGGFGPAIELELASMIIYDIADVDGDGLLDVFGREVDLLTGQSLIARALGDATFELIEVDPELVSSGEFAALDDDPIVDLLVAQRGMSGYVQPRHGVGDGSFTLGEEQSIPNYIVSALADMDSDGDADLVLATDAYPGAHLSIWAANGHTQFEDPGWQIPIEPPSELHIGRFDGDSERDVAYTANGQLVVWTGESLESGPMLGSALLMPLDGRVRVVVDLNGDGLDDLCAIASNGGGAVVYLSNP